MEKHDYSLEVYKEALDVAVFNLVYNKGFKSVEEKKAKKEEIKQFCLEVAELMVNLNKGEAKFKKIE